MWPTDGQPACRLNSGEAGIIGSHLPEGPRSKRKKKIHPVLENPSRKYGHPINPIVGTYGTRLTIMYDQLDGD